MANNNKRFTQTGTDIEEVKRQNAQGKSSSTFGTNPQKVREEIAQEGGFGNQTFAQPSQPGKTPAGTNIQQVREEIAEESGFATPNSQPNPTPAKTPAGTNIQQVREEIAEESGFQPQQRNKKNQPNQ